MGYHVTILHTDGTRQLPIAKTELLELLRSRPDLGFREAEAGHVEFWPADDPDASLLVWQNGEIWTDGPDEATLARMLELAEQLGARVRGDELETYRTPTETYTHPDDEQKKIDDAALVKELLRKRRIRQWALNAAIFGFFALLFLLVRALSAN